MKVFDLTHNISPDMPVYPGTEPPVFETANSYEVDGFKEMVGMQGKKAYREED